MYRICNPLDVCELSISLCKWVRIDPYSPPSNYFCISVFLAPTNLQQDADWKKWLPHQLMPFVHLTIGPIKSLVWKSFGNAIQSQASLADTIIHPVRDSALVVPSGKSIIFPPPTYQEYHHNRGSIVVGFWELGFILKKKNLPDQCSKRNHDY